MYVGFDKLDQVINVVGAEVVEDEFNRQGGGKLDQEVEQQEEKRRHCELLTKSSMALLMSNSWQLGRHKDLGCGGMGAYCVCMIE